MSRDETNNRRDVRRLKRVHLPSTALVAMLSLMPVTGQAVATPPAPASLSEGDLAIARSAFRAADLGRWADAEANIAQSRDPLPAKILLWSDLLRPGSGHSFSEITDFADKNPDWPLLSLLRLRAEAQIATVPDPVALAYLQKHKPATPVGKLHLADLLIQSGQAGEAEQVIRDTWVNADFDSVEEVRIRRDYGQYIHPADDIRRLDRLLWQGQVEAARGMLPRVAADERALGAARLAFATSARNAEQLASQVPKALQSEPALLFEHARWLRRKDKNLEAAQFLARIATSNRPDLVWAERQIVARRLVQQGEAETAYDLVANHHLSDPSQLVDAEFTAGWIALRFMKAPAKAAPHFATLVSIGTLPVTLARGAYWSGRAAEAMGKQQEATDWYNKAAHYPTTYYGQLANCKPNVMAQEKPVAEPVASPEARAAFEQRELVRAVRLLLSIDEEERIKPFLGKLSEAAQGVEEYAAVADFADSIGRPDLGVSIARRAGMRGVSLLRAGYPIIWLPRNAGAEQALLLAIVRQESAFDHRALSPTGARGFMQLMPGTAHDVSRSLGVAFQPEKLLDDGRYNVTLGQAYFDSLLSDFNGSYVLSIAAYNAGPGRVAEWIGTFGDPRSGAVDPVDWVESIPFNETRNYVQRVLENLQVYRLGIGDKSLAFSLEADLKR